MKKQKNVNRIAAEYQRMVLGGTAEPIGGIVGSEDIATAIESGLCSVNKDTVRSIMRWLGGEAKVDPKILPAGIRPQLVDSFDFGSVLRGLAHISVKVDGKVPLYIIDEAEQLKNITETDTFFSWLAAMRELTELNEVAMIFMVGAKTRDYLPHIFQQDEIIRRIGVKNFVEFLNPGPEDIREFLLEQFQTTIKKGAVPQDQHDVVSPEALEETAVPEELLKITGGDQKRLETYPFEPDAFDQFVDEISGGDLSNKPSEAQMRLQRAAQRAMRLDKQTIDMAIMDQLEAEAY